MPAQIACHAGSRACAVAANPVHTSEAARTLSAPAAGFSRIQRPARCAHAIIAPGRVAVRITGAGASLACLPTAHVGEAIVGDEIARRSTATVVALARGKVLGVRILARGEARVTGCVLRAIAIPVAGSVIATGAACYGGATVGEWWVASFDVCAGRSEEH